VRLGVVSVVLCLWLSGLAGAASPVARLPEKVDLPAGTPTYEGRVGGEDIEHAVVIPPNFPWTYTDAGNTCDFLDDYDEVCPYTGSVAPDVVYSLTPYNYMCLTVSLCNSFYDTKLYIYEDEWTPGEPYACNDDADCYSPPVPFTSEIGFVVLYPGHTYYIVVDGYGADCGDYVLELSEWSCPPPLECPPEGVEEGEPDCYDGYVDEYDGGCNSEPHAFVELAPSSETIFLCGTTGNYDDNAMRDTDWYLLDLTCDETTVTAWLRADFGAVLGFIDMSPGCENITSFHSYVMGEPYLDIQLTETLPAGEWCVFVSTSDWSGWPCGSRYHLTIDGYDSCVAVEDLSWSTIKGLYR